MAREGRKETQAERDIKKGYSKGVWCEGCAGSIEEVKT